MALFLTYFSYFSLRPTLLGFVNKVCNLKFYIFQFPSFRNFFTQYGINMITLQHQDIELLLQQQLPHKLLLVSMKQTMVTQQLPLTSQVIQSLTIAIVFELIYCTGGHFQYRKTQLYTYIFFQLMKVMTISPQLTRQMMNIKTMEKLKKANLHLNKSKAYPSGVSIAS